MSDIKSPDTLDLRGKPLVGARLGKRALLVFAGVIGVMFLVIVINTESRKAQMAEKPREEASAMDQKLAPALTVADSLTKNAPDEVVIAADTPELEGPPTTFDVSSAPAPSSVPVLDPMAVGTDVPALHVSEADRMLQEERERIEREARKSGSSIGGWDSSDQGQGVAMNASPPPAPLAAPSLQTAMQAMPQMPAGMGLPGMPGAAPAAPADQEKKREFVASAQGDLDPPYLAASRQPPRSRYELKTGTVIPAVMLQGINSDLPGEMVAIVREAVYDTATGRHVLIPQGAKLFGSYDSSVAYGQRRALVVWRRLIYPDGSTLELGGMQGADAGGYAGFEDEVDNHYGRLVGFGLLTSLMSAAFQVSQPEESGDGQALTPRQIAAGEVGRELSQLGIEATRRNMNLQPTIKIRPGYRFVVTVNRDVAFAAPWAPPAAISTAKY